MSEHNGLMFYRQGRFIDCMRHIPSEAREVFQTYDVNIKLKLIFHLL